MGNRKIIVYNTHQWHPVIWPNMVSLQTGFEQQRYDTVLCNFDDSESLQAGHKLLVQLEKNFYQESIGIFAKAKIIYQDQA